MTEQPASSTIIGAHRRRGVAYAVAAAVLAAALLFLPILLVGYTIQVVASVATGEILAWQSTVGLSYAILGPFVLLSILLLIIPLRLGQAAAGIIGRSGATLWVGGLLAAALAGVALVWLVQAQLRSTYASQPEYWYALAFAVAAVVILLATVLMARGSAIAAAGVLGAAAGGVLVLGVILVAVWGSANIPADAQTVGIISTPSGVEIRPKTVHAGPVYFVPDGANDEVRGHGEVSFVSAGYDLSSHGSELLLPLTEGAARSLILGDYGAASIESTMPGVSRVTLRAGYYAFVVLGAGGGLPGVPPESVTLLEVLP